MFGQISVEWHVQAHPAEIVSKLLPAVQLCHFVLRLSLESTKRLGRARLAKAMSEFFSSQQHVLRFLSSSSHSHLVSISLEHKTDSYLCVSYSCGGLKDVQISAWSSSRGVKFDWECSGGLKLTCWLLKTQVEPRCFAQNMTWISLSYYHVILFNPKSFNWLT